MTRIVYLYGELMSQYGEYSSLTLLRARLESAGEAVAIDRVNEGDALDLTGCDLLYIPAGTERSLLAAANAIAKHTDEIESYCVSGGLALLTGNAGALFGGAIESFDGSFAEGLGLLDLDAKIIDKRRYSEFIMNSNELGGGIIGAINTSVEFTSREEPLFEIEFDAAHILGESYEGTKKGRVFATQLIGPLLVRTPAALDYFASAASGLSLPESTAEWRRYSEAGYKSALATLKRESGAVK